MNCKNGLMAFLGGAVVGAVVGILFAPEKGEVTRRKIGEAAREGRDRIEDAFESGKEMLADVYNKGRERISDAIHEKREMINEEIAGICKDKN